MFGNTKSMREIDRDTQLARIFNVFASNDLKKAKKLLTAFVSSYGGDNANVKPVVVAVNHLALWGTRREASDFALKLAQGLPPENLLRLSLLSRARDLGERPGPQARRIEPMSMTPDEFIMKIGSTPFVPK